MRESIRRVPEVGEVAGGERANALEKGSPAVLGGKECGAGAAFFFLLFEGKRKLEGLVFNWNAKYKLLWIFVAFEPDSAGDAIFGLNGGRLQRQRQNLLGGVVESSLTLLANGILLSILLANDVIGSGDRGREGGFE